MTDGGRRRPSSPAPRYPLYRDAPPGAEPADGAADRLRAGGRRRFVRGRPAGGPGDAREMRRGARIVDLPEAELDAEEPGGRAGVQPVDRRAVLVPEPRRQPDRRPGVEPRRVGQHLAQMGVVARPELGLDHQAGAGGGVPAQEVGAKPPNPLLPRQGYQAEPESVAQAAQVLRPRQPGHEIVPLAVPDRRRFDPLQTAEREVVHRGGRPSWCCGLSGRQKGRRGFRRPDLAE